MLKRISLWLRINFGQLTNQEFQQLGFKHILNVHGDMRKIYQCKSMWEDENGIIYKGSEIFPIQPGVDAPLTVNAANPLTTINPDLKKSRIFFNEVKEEVYQLSKSKLFWEKGLQENDAERVMLIICELAEAVEADRDRKWYKNSNITGVNGYIDSLYDGHCDFGRWKEVFEIHIKPTVECELADVVLRICDYCGGFDITIIEREYRKSFSGNFAEDILTVTSHVMKSYEAETELYSSKDWGYVIASIYALAAHYGIDLDRFVIWKHEYNKRRPAKHGKAY